MKFETPVFVRIFFLVCSALTAAGLLYFYSYYPYINSATARRNIFSPPVDAPFRRGCISDRYFSLNSAKNASTQGDAVVAAVAAAAEESNRSAVDVGRYVTFGGGWDDGRRLGNQLFIFAASSTWRN